MTGRANTGRAGAGRASATDTTIVLVRHAVTDWSDEGRWQGRADLPLNERGREQAAALAEELEPLPVGAIYASDLRRAHETALVVARRKGLAVTPLPELREIDVGSWTGLTRAEIQERFPEAYVQVRARTAKGWDGGETYAELNRRVLGGLLRIAAAHPGDAVLVVTHNGPIRAVHAHAVGLDFATDRTAGPNVAHGVLSAVVVGDGVFRRADGELLRSLGARRTGASA